MATHSESSPQCCAALYAHLRTQDAPHRAFTTTSTSTTSITAAFTKTPTTLAIAAPESLDRFRSNWSGLYDCWPCKLQFAERDEFAAHLESAAHQPMRFRCPREECGEGFARFGGLLGHLGMGECESWVGEEVEVLRGFLE